MKRRDFVKNKAIKLKSKVLWKKYKEIRNSVTTKIRRSKTQYFNEKITSSKVNCHSFWKTVGKLVPNKKNISTAPTDVNANDFNEHFVNIGAKVASKAGESEQMPVFKHPDCLYQFDMIDITLESVVKRLKSLGSRSSLDFRNMDTKLLSLSSDVIATYITKLFNLTIKTGIIPDDWKVARVTPIYKGKGNKDDMSNYRPISITLHVMKILEHEVLDQLMIYLNKYQLLTPDQSAFLKRHSTETCLHRVVTDWIDNIDNNLFTGVCFLDIEKCFDSINHEILLYKLGKCGIKMLWFENYLKNRKQFVTLNNIKSQKQLVRTGVPQGSVLGPLLFILYANDISANVNVASCNLYADDAIMYVCGNTLEETSGILNECMTDVDNWYKTNRLSVNASKSSSMLIRSNRKNIDETKFNIKIGNSDVEYVTSTKYLGLTIDPYLNWTEHVHLTAAELRSKLSLFRRIAKFLPQPVLSRIFLVYLQPRIDYCLTVWGFSSSANIKCIQRIQNTAARIIFNNFDYINTRSADLLRNLSWINVEHRRDFLMAKLMFKCLHGQAPNYLSDMFYYESEVHNYPTRHSQALNLKPPTFNTELFRTSLVYQGTSVWNKLPLHIKECKTISIFHKQCLNHFKS